MPALRVRAPAKINLSLRVGLRRADGFHELRTIFQSLALCDRLSFESRRGPFEIRCTDPGVPIDASNLVWKAASRLWSRAGRAGDPHGILVSIDKRIPAQGGLGGGSSDAAAALLALRRLWKLRLADAELSAIAAEIGSDVPYFLVGGTALGLGRGEEIYPLEDLPPLPLVLVLPPFGVSTREAYGWLDGDREANRRAVAAEAVRYRTPRPFLAHLELDNDLEAPVAARHPEIGTLKALLVRHGAVLSAMSGSGSAVYGVFGSAGAARRAAGLLGRRVRVVLTSLAPRRKR